MKKMVYFIPAIIHFLFYGLAIMAGLALSPLVIVWFILYIISGILLSMNRFWGGLIGLIPSIQLIYMGTKDTGQIIKETPIGLVLLAFYVICSSFVYYKNKKISKK